MIRHIVMFKLKEENKEASICEFIKRAEALISLEQVKEGRVVRKMEGVPNANFDVALIFDFDTLDCLNAYQVCPTHVEFGKFVGSIREDRACIDYEI